MKTESRPALLLGMAILAVVALFVLSSSPSRADIAGIGTHSTVSGSTCETQNATSRSFSSSEVSAPDYASPFYQETDTLLLTEHSGGCSGPVTSTSTTTVSYPVTPEMVYQACYPGYSSCTAYPQYLVQAYQQQYPGIMSGTALVSVVELSALGGTVTPSSVVTWEAVLA